ncbi:MAG: helix-turn-helix transcriptional regulator [Candidatus Omnitrophota bacterium]
MKKHRTNQPLFEVRGNIPSVVLQYLKEQFGQDVDVLSEDNQTVNITDTNWYKKVRATTTPGEVLKIYRENAALTQEELGLKIGKFSRQKVSDMERGKRTISKMWPRN